MVAVIEGKEEAGGARYIEFTVYQSPTEPDRALASWRFPPSGRAIEESKPGTSIESRISVRRGVRRSTRRAIRLGQRSRRTVSALDPAQVMLVLLDRGARGFDGAQRCCRALRGRLRRHCAA